MGAQASIVPESFSWLSRVTSFAQRREPISPVSVGQVAMNQSHMCGLWKAFIVTYLSFREAKPSMRESRCFNTQESEAVLRVRLKVVRLHNRRLINLHIKVTVCLGVLVDSFTQTWRIMSLWCTNPMPVVR